MSATPLPRLKDASTHAVSVAAHGPAQAAFGSALLDTFGSLSSQPSGGSLFEAMSSSVRRSLRLPRPSLRTRCTLSSLGKAVRYCRIL